MHCPKIQFSTLSQLQCNSASLLVSKYPKCSGSTVYSSLTLLHGLWTQLVFKLCCTANIITQTQIEETATNCVLKVLPKIPHNLIGKLIFKKPLCGVCSLWCIVFYCVPNLTLNICSGQQRRRRQHQSCCCCWRSWKKLLGQFWLNAQQPRQWITRYL